MDDTELLHDLPGPLRSDVYLHLNRNIVEKVSSTYTFTLIIVLISKFEF